MRFATQGRRSDVGGLRIGGHLPPPHQALTLLGYDALNNVFAFRSLIFPLRQEDDSGGEFPRFRQFGFQIHLSDFPHELVRQRGHDPRAIPRVGFTAAGTAVVHIPQHQIGVPNDLMAPFALDVSDKADTATVTLVDRIIKAMLARKPERIMY